MCRLLTYIGPEIGLTSLLCDPEHSLVSQSFRPKLMISGTVNADGFGVGWYVPGDPSPAVYKSVLPIWADANLLSMGSKIRPGHFLAAIRGATDGQPTSYENTQPFVHDRFSFIHNGSLHRFRELWMRPLRDALPDPYYGYVKGSTDSEHIFALWLSLLGDARGPDAMLRALEATVEHLNAIAARLNDGPTRTSAYLTMAISDGEWIVATRHGSGERTASLFALERAGAYPGAVVLASEPLSAGDPWREVPHRSFVVAGPDSSLAFYPGGG